MGHREEFEATLAANEDDFETRLIFADWLEEHGETAEAERHRKWPESKAWLMRFIENSECPPYDLVVKAAMNIGEYVSVTEHVSGTDDDGEDYEYDDQYGCRIDKGSFYSGGRDASGEIPAEFWDHLEVVTGRQMTSRPEYFRCAC